MLSRLIVIAGLGIASFATPALAEGQLGRTSTGTISISVEIPPLGSAVAAAREGAVGLWTITNASDGLMVHLPDTISDASDAAGTMATVFGNKNVVFETAMEKNPFVELASADTMDDRGLSRHAFRLSLTHTNLVPDQNSNATVDIIGV